MKRTLGPADLEAIEDKVAHYRATLLDEAYETVFLAKHWGIRKAVDAVFDDHKGLAIPLPALMTLAATKVGGVASGSDYRRVASAIVAYLRLPSNREWISITKGRNGGCRRIKDLPKKKC